MTGLKPTGPRLALMRAIAAGCVKFDPVDAVYVLHDQIGTARCNDLRRFDLVRQVRFIDTEPTDAGRAWLAQHDREPAQ